MQGLAIGIQAAPLLKRLLPSKKIELLRTSTNDQVSGDFARWPFRFSVLGGSSRETSEPQITPIKEQKSYSPEKVKSCNKIRVGANVPKLMAHLLSRCT
jgi:hypothetical protein